MGGQEALLLVARRIHGCSQELRRSTRTTDMARRYRDFAEP